ncbi:hypothetical protein RHSIM_Rhsim12G0049800 [Rhododendron simsii]|uniref:Uncharacterized protein n=1 Tax=Rhododendron simsii TaxID=118357 RepID=A0A834G2L3_RHOSS|nr:hypothetical protein RHSIM_Rhsim12G0049800 [Rhododendron simsii]
MESPEVENGMSLESRRAGGDNMDGVAAGLLLLVDGGNDAPGGAAGADDFLVGDGEEVVLHHGELLGFVQTGDFLHELDRSSETERERER